MKPRNKSETILPIVETVARYSLQTFSAGTENRRCLSVFTEVRPIISFIFMLLPLYTPSRDGARTNGRIIPKNRFPLIIIQLLIDALCDFLHQSGSKIYVLAILEILGLPTFPKVLSLKRLARPTLCILQT